MAKNLEIEIKNLEFVQNISLLLKDILNDKNIPKEIRKEYEKRFLEIIKED